MPYERYTLRQKWPGDFEQPPTWLSVRNAPYFNSEEEAEKYYELTFNFINESCKGRDVAVFKIVHNEIFIKEL